MTALVDRLEQLHTEATQPPWNYSNSEVLGIVVRWADAEGALHYGRDAVEAVGPQGDPQAEIDRALIVELRNALPALLDVVRAARQVLRAIDDKIAEDGWEGMPIGVHACLVVLAEDLAPLFGEDTTP